MKPKLILIRGLPGSGKSTLAKQILETGEYEHFEADMYFIRRGVYSFEPKRLKAAHEWCRIMTGISLSLDKSVIVSNTFVKKWEINPYLKIANILDASVRIIEAKGNYKSIHNVPQFIIERMKKNWENFDDSI